MDHFPTASELLAASALLLLSSPCQFDESWTIGVKSDQRGAVDSNTLSSHSKSSSSTTSVVTADGSTEEINRRRLRSSDGIVARYREIRFKVPRRKRSKRYFICTTEHNDSKDMGKAMTASSESAQEAVSETLSVSTSSEPCHEEVTIIKKKEISSGHLWRRAEAILKFLKSGGCASEVRIRQVLGDNPDTSKALRILLKQEEIGRSGSGGRSDPYIYKLK